KLKKKGKVVVAGVDNIWKGTIKQRLASWLSSFMVKPYFSHLWVAGIRQYQFASRLGFNDEEIITGLYAADIHKFGTALNQPFNKYILYVGRFEEIKGVRFLYNVFNSLTEQE